MRWCLSDRACYAGPSDGHGEGITAVTIAGLPDGRPARICGVSFIPAEE